MMVLRAKSSPTFHAWRRRRVRWQVEISAKAGSVLLLGPTNPSPLRCHHRSSHRLGIHQDFAVMIHVQPNTLHPPYSVLQQKDIVLLYPRLKWKLRPFILLRPLPLSKWNWIPPSVQTFWSPPSAIEVSEQVNVRGCAPSVFRGLVTSCRFHYPCKRDIRR